MSKQELTIMYENRVWLQEQFENFATELDENLVYALNVDDGIEVDDPMVTLAAERVTFFKPKDESIGKDEYGKNFTVGSEVIDFLKGPYTEYARKKTPLTNQEKELMKKKFFQLINKVTDDTEITMKKVMFSPTFKKYFKVSAQGTNTDDDDDFIDDEE